MNLRRIFAILTLGLVLSGCITSQSYLDPKFKAIGYGDIKQVKNKHNVFIDVEFQRNGEHLSAVDNQLRTNVEKIFLKSGVVIPSADAGKMAVKVVCNNIADVDGAMSKGFTTGLTLGASGTVVTDFYQVTVEYRQGKKLVKKKYDHAIHTTIGNKQAPVKGVKPTSLNEAFGGVVKDVILQFIKEMQAKNMLTLKGHLLNSNA